MQPTDSLIHDDATRDYGETERGAAERLTFFSDAVVAIAITLLAIDLPVPDGRTASELAAGFAANWSEYLAFLVSFAVIARHWVSHHRLFRYVARASTSVVWLDMLWLLIIVVTPFLTRFIAVEHAGVARYAVYIGAQALQTLVFALMVLRLGRSGSFLPGTPQSWLRNGWVPSAITALAFLVSLPLFGVIGPAAFVTWGVLPSLGMRATNALGITVREEKTAP